MNAELSEIFLTKILSLFSLPHPYQAKLERDQRYGAPPAPVYRLPPGAIDVRKSVGGSRGSYQIKDGDCLYRIAINHGEDYFIPIPSMVFFSNFFLTCVMTAPSQW